MQILLAIPPLTAALIMLLLDRHLGAHFFDAQNGGSAYLWQHLFWFFGHPEVYILILPVFGMVSEVIPVFSRKVLFGYEFMAAATMAIAFISLGVWAHHMFAVGMSRHAGPVLRRCQLLVSIPTGIKFFNWLATMYGGRIRFASPMLFCLRLPVDVPDRRADRASCWRWRPFDFQLSDSYFVVGHFHWVLIGGTLFGDLRRHPLLVSQGDRPDALRAAGALAVLAARHRLHPDVRPDAHLGHAGHAAADLHLRGRPRLGDLEPAHHARGARPGAELR